MATAPIYLNRGEPPYVTLCLNRLSGTQITRTYRSYQGVIAVTLDMGNVAAISDPVIWVFGYIRDPSVEYIIANATITQRPYYTSQYTNVQEMVCSTVLLMQLCVTDSYPDSRFLVRLQECSQPRRHSG